MGKKNKIQPIPKSTPLVKTKVDKPQATPTAPKKIFSFDFFLFIFRNKENRTYCYAGLIIGLISFIILRSVFPHPSFYYDSYTYVGAAKTNEQISYRPIEYSQIIRFFHTITTSDFALIFGQYFSNVIANLLLFFSCLFFFPMKRWVKIVAFVLLIVNPLYVLYSNYVLSDAFFCSITIVFFVTLIFTLRKPQWWQLVLQVVLLLLLFKLRYNAVIFPLFIAFAVFLSKQAIWRKSLWIGVSCVAVFLQVNKITDTNEEITNVREFSPFAGWQMANNALHVFPYLKKGMDSSVFDEDTKDVYVFMKHYFDTVHKQNTMAPPNGGVTATFMWNKESPLKKYINPYAIKAGLRDYFLAWVNLGPVYNKFGKQVIFNQPILYLNHFVLPNAKEYLFPPLEAYNLYNENHDTIAPVAKEYFQYKTNKVSLKGASVYPYLIKPWSMIFTGVNFIIIGLVLFYFIARVYTSNSKFFNLTVLLFLFFSLANIGFVVLLAPSVFRYHVFILTLFWVFILYFIQQIVAHYSKKSVVEA